MNKNIYNELEKFRNDRNLDKNPHNKEVFLKKIYEEIFEYLGFDDKFCKRAAETRAKLEMEYIKQYDIDNPGKRTENSFVKVDALCDMQIYCIEGVEQLGFNNEIAMLEVAEEINSREGEIINGKFEKYRTPEAVAKWYKADFHKAIREKNAN